MKKFFVPFLVIVFLFTIIDDASAQRRGKKKRRKTEDTERSSTRDREDDFESTSIAEKLNIEIKPGNLNFFGNQLSISLKSNVGYKFNNVFSAGAGGKFFYDYINSFGSSADISAFSYGGLVYGRAKITQTFYLQGEYNIVSFGAVSTVPQETIAYPLAGIGYVQQGYDWSFGLELLAILNDRVRDKPQGTIVEYWINFSKNF
ncbi:MAG: hypothetical protein P1U56_15280 [Saprospiraceae bacterium]|nr:hypothetical protein [Saprospiraceae bacterium]